MCQKVWGYKLSSNPPTFWDLSICETKNRTLKLETNVFLVPFCKIMRLFDFFCVSKVIFALISRLRFSCHFVSWIVLLYNKIWLGINKWLYTYNILICHLSWINVCIISSIRDLWSWIFGNGIETKLNGSLFSARKFSQIVSTKVMA